jgi:hypothetical protein
MLSGLNDYGEAFLELVKSDGWDVGYDGVLRHRELFGLTELSIARFAGGWALFLGPNPAQQYGEPLWRALTRGRSFIHAPPEWRRLMVNYAVKEAGLARARRALAETDQ